MSTAGEGGLIAPIFQAQKNRFSAVLLSGYAVSRLRRQGVSHLKKQAAAHKPIISPCCIFVTLFIEKNVGILVFISCLINFKVIIYNRLNMKGSLSARYPVDSCRGRSACLAAGHRALGNGYSSPVNGRQQHTACLSGNFPVGLQK